MNRKLTAALLIAAAVLTNVAFTALGTVFDYPDMLKEPVDDILAAFRASQGAVDRLVHGAGAVGGAVRADRHRRRPALHAAARCGSRCRSASPPRSCR